MNAIFAEPSFVPGAEVLVVLLFSGLVIGAIILFIVKLLKAVERGNQPHPPAQPPPVAPSTQIVPRNCPQCGAELKSDAPEGLCPACLLQRGIATEGGAPPGQPPFVPPDLAELAKLFPQLEILEPIGKGGMGAVYKARQSGLDRLVALKILAKPSAGDLDFASRFTREARALAKLSHPNIVAVYDFGQTNGLSYFIMEYVDGPNLRQIEQAGKLSPREALQIIPQICTALQFAHDEGIVHRDIKPENVLLDKKGRVKIADFGLAKILGQEPNALRLTGAKDVMGTPHYMAPEQVEKPREVDHRADIYSLGVVFYEMLTGELPLGKFQPPSAKVQVDVRLDEVVLRSLEKEPERRYQHVSEVKTQVETIATTPEPGRSRREEAQTESERRKAESGKPSESLMTSNAANEAPRYSRPALAGAIWSGMGLLICVSAAMFELKDSLASRILALFFLTAPFVTTILGWVAVSQIRRSGGRLYGLGLAVFDGLLFPLLALDALIFGLLYLFVSFGAHLIWPTSAGNGSFGGGLAVGYQIGLCLAIWIGSAIVISAIVDFLIVRRVWRAVNAPRGEDQRLLTSSPTNKESSEVKTQVETIAATGGAGVPPAEAGVAPGSSPNKSTREPARFSRAWRFAAVVFVIILSYDLSRTIFSHLITGRSNAVKSDYIGQTWFPLGDSIEISSVKRTKDQMTVKGHYNLVSHDQATLALYITSTNLTNFPEDPQETMHISKGRGNFELSRGHLVPGLPHVNMYPINGGGPFAELYFGTKKEALEESKLDLNPSVAVPSGLIAWWRAEGNALDSADGNNGILMNGAGFAQGKVGQAFSFNGTRQCVQVPYSPSLITSNYSVEAWIEPLSQVSSTVPAQNIIFGQSYGYAQLVVRPGTSGVKLREEGKLQDTYQPGVWAAFQFGTSPYTFYGVQSTNEIPIGQFTHVAGTWDGTTLRLYINGVFNAQSIPGATTATMLHLDNGTLKAQSVPVTTPVAPVDSGCPFFIGGCYSPAAGSCQYVGQFFNGRIDELSVYNRALSQEEIQAIYNAGEAGKRKVE